VKPMINAPARAVREAKERGENMAARVGISGLPGKAEISRPRNH